MRTTLRCKPLMMAASLLIASVSLASQATPKTNLDKLNTLTVQTSVMTEENYQPQANTNMFPAPQGNMVQHILTLPKLNNESEYLIEIQVGQNKLVDCNKVKLLGEIITLSLDGWGYRYYQVNSMMEGPNTKMMCTDAKTAQFVVLNDSLKQAYDSRLPKVFYLPKDAQLRYRIWRVASEFEYSVQ
ncbi:MULTISPECIES: serine protease inhibitor ecotin [Shewanella]|uniref:Serine protease inhibitor ecotin n=1 Tax=Shewanella metallivivens TaxID=2872342 RepID=A0ABT5TIB9_9GAMM|nr:serine protease inhibitor ecotin [Shewanella metallivivens]MDD8058358.1 serine protease inhibitor ecotin [Shewanella metallivivens]